MHKLIYARYILERYNLSMDVKMWYLPVFQRQILHALLHLRELFGSIFNAVLDDLSVLHRDIVAFGLPFLLLTLMVVIARGIRSLWKAINTDMH